MTLPRVAREPVIEQTFDIGRKVAQPAALRLLGQVNLERRMRAAVKFISRKRPSIPEDR